MAHKDPKLWEFIEYALSTDTDDCILWPFSISPQGYARLGIEKVSRLILKRKIGACRDKDAAHSCRNRHCINPRHLSYKTRKENLADKYVDGTIPITGIATQDQIDYIVQHIYESSFDIGQALGLNPSTVRGIRSRIRWKGAAYAYL